MSDSKPSRRDLLCAGGTLAAGAMLEGLLPCHAADLPFMAVTAESVRRAIQRGCEFLKRRQQPDGTWPNRPRYADGLTALCVLALLQAGYPPTDPVVQRGLDWLRGYVPDSTYTASFQTMVLCSAQPERDLMQIQRNVRWVESRQVREGPRAGMWATPSTGSTDHIDNSMTHMALLGLYEAERVGVQVNDATWRLALAYWQRAQNLDGSWGWGPGDDGTGSMTCAGIASIIVASGVIGKPDAQIVNDRVVGCATQQTSNYLDRALGWLERNFTVARNPGYEFWRSYYLYSLERAARLSARRFIGRHDWYREGAKALVAEQQTSGAWPSDIQFDRQEDQHVSTSFSLLFLAKGQRPILLGHLKHEPQGDWNRHRTAMFNLIACVEQAWHMPLAYQIMDIGPATVEDLLESPVLFINGRDAPQFTDEECRKLRMYVDRGGFLFAEQCCWTGDFDHGIRQLLAKVFPEPDSTLQLLSPGHPAWYAERQVGASYVRPLWGIDVGCRTGVIYCPQDLSCYWELGRAGRMAHFSPAVQKQIDAALAVGLNVLAYATNRELKVKDPNLPDRQNATPAKAAQRGQLQVANVLHPGGCDAAPAALGNLLHLMADRYHVLVGDEPRQVRLTDDRLFQYHLVFLHGRKAFELTPTEKRQFRTYVERGGIVFADAVCSSEEFIRSWRQAMKDIFPDRPLAPISASHPLFSAQFGGETIDSVTVRLRREPGSTGPMVRRQPPRLEGIDLSDHYGVIFSPYDISCAMEGRAAMDYEGYSREDAVRLAVNVFLYSLGQ